MVDFTRQLFLCVFVCVCVHAYAYKSIFSKYVFQPLYAGLVYMTYLLYTHWHNFFVTYYTCIDIYFFPLFNADEDIYINTYNTMKSTTETRGYIMIKAFTVSLDSGKYIVVQHGITFGIIL